LPTASTPTRTAPRWPEAKATDRRPSPFSLEALTATTRPGTRNRADPLLLADLAIGAIIMVSARRATLGNEGSAIRRRYAMLPVHLAAR
jgi:hypothetical protein